MIIEKYRNCKSIDVYFPEYNWTTKNVQYGNFIRKTIRCPYEPVVYNHGYLGEGLYKSSENGKLTKVYKTWNGMLERCYSKKLHEKHSSYIGCKVCDEWLNFQNFAEWYNENYYEIPGEKMNLDKDILIKGNKIYGPDTCVFVPQSINKLFIKSDANRGELPIGVYYHKKNKKYGVQCNVKGLGQKYLGTYNTPEEAFQVYKQNKEHYIKEIANKYIELIPSILYQAMIDYKVEYDD